MFCSSLLWFPGCYLLLVMFMDEVFIRGPWASGELSLALASALPWALSKFKGKVRLLTCDVARMARLRFLSASLYCRRSRWLTMSLYILSAACFSSSTYLSSSACAYSTFYSSSPFLFSRAIAKTFFIRARSMPLTNLGGCRLLTRASPMVIDFLSGGCASWGV